jgi:hypothetical protein
MVARPQARLAGVAALVAALAAAPAGAGALVVTGACRDGVANGAYEARTASGALRIAGAFHLGLRTSSFLFWDERGARLAQLPYDEGQLSGTIALWYPASDARGDARRQLEAGYRRGRPHGLRRAWDEAGRLRGEDRYEEGVLVDARAFDEQGGILADAAARVAAERALSAAARALAQFEGLVDDNPISCAARGL